ncbi:hypothetical protein SPRG_12994 [Saprolegnia parasitica CBS 223.65]|uniref:Endoplasmic reticulum transmembrane protein n=1 Tax=Saprolegnia parasitica (strain CBS 223.65) TaxID=695850 RepID=A0A067C1G9_SAPPC|nr:hypothetical protein SPRG_12994 [Saprolegnia parasitica CBS 223.65]KDO20637.1 hypothetical protein SPRG_12994 [Saprolegnia parasitica CBS 223.65]|eukprot:XP_012208691.1 hypothetical protein SPRG_12994 [Saprolegnia parasitica CBS 223.65]
MILNELLFGLLCVEAVVCLFLCLPFFKHMTQATVAFLSTNVFPPNSGAAMVGNIVLAVVGLLFLANVQTSLKYRNSDEVLSDGLRIRLLVAQRDMYISGFCLFLFALLRLVYSSMYEAMEKQAKNASSGYSKLIDEHDTLQKQLKKLSGFEADGKGLEALLAENAALEKEVSTLKKSLATAETTVENVKKQAENQSTAYMKLLDDSAAKDAKVDELKAAQTSIADLKSTVAELTKERDSLKTQIQDYDFMFADAKKKAL